MKRRDFLKIVAAAAVSPTIVAGAGAPKVVTFPAQGADWGEITSAHFVDGNGMCVDVDLSENPVRLLRLYIGENKVDKESFDKALAVLDEHIEWTGTNES